MPTIKLVVIFAPKNLGTSGKWNNSA